MFTGPLFIVGMPRSGNTLLRDLLNRHPRISLPVSETVFIPDMVRCFGARPDFAKARERGRIHASLGRTNFFGRMKSLGREMPRAHLDSIEDQADWSVVLQSILRFYGDADGDALTIWGDQTPSYLTQIGMLKEICPTARFLHVVRDPRDHCLSMRRTWGKSILRAADRWRDDVAAARRAGAALAGDYVEMRYEDLVTEPHRTLAAVCRAIDCDSGAIPVEMAELRQRNTQEYRTGLSPAEVGRIEEIAWPVMREVGYATTNAVAFRPLSKAARAGLAVWDAWAMTWFQVKTKGPVRGIRYQLLAYSRRPSRLGRGARLGEPGGAR
jgi:hypothetical protein